MTKAVQKIALSPCTDIPFDKLILSQSNVRLIKAGVSVEELAEDIAGPGLLQIRSVRPVLDADGSETGNFEIPTGGRRFQALSLLMKQKRLAKTTPIPCIVRDAASAILAENDSLAENMQRVALHPLDQFRAFLALGDKGQSDAEIAAAFLVTPQIVKQRLKPASVAPALLEAYAEDGMTLEQLMAFTVNPSHARQVQVWDVIQSSWNKEPFQVRRMLTEASVRASDRRAVFVGVDAYEAAGDTMLHDLFQGDDGGWLFRLVTENSTLKLRQLRLRAVSGSRSRVTCPSATATGCGLCQVILHRWQMMKARVRMNCLTRSTLGVLDAEMETTETQPLIFDQTEIGRAGEFVTLDRYGPLAVYGSTHLLQNIQNVCILCANGDPDYARASRVQGSRSDAAHK